MPSPDLPERHCRSVPPSRRSCRVHSLSLSKRAAWKNFSSGSLLFPLSWLLENDLDATYPAHARR